MKAIDVDFGAGSGKFPLREETLMSWSIIKAGGVLRYPPIVFLIQPPLSSNSTFSAQNVKATFAVHWTIFGLAGILTFSGFLLNSFRRYLTSS